MESTPEIRNEFSEPSHERRRKSEIVKGALALLRTMITSRVVDEVEMELVNRGEAFFHVGAAGHEGIVALHPHLIADDWLHLHYRDKALMLARGIPPEQFFHSLLCNGASHSAGRQMSAHLSARHLNILSLVGPVGNNALQAVGVAQQIKERPSHPIVLCAVGDGTSQQGEFLEAVAEAVRSELPVLFCIEDNSFAISTKTDGRTFFDLPDGPAEKFYGIDIERISGEDVLSAGARLGVIVHAMRKDRRPAIVVFEFDRLTHHTNADDERVYREAEEISRVKRESDPISRLTAQLVDSGVLISEIDAMKREINESVRAAAQRALSAAEPIANLDARAPLPSSLVSLPAYTGNESSPRLTMIEAIREVLRTRLASDPAVSLFGEDIEDPKGDVFGITRGLSNAFPGRVQNSALAESTIVGSCIGRALAGGKPVAFVQFADFLPIAFNQIASELGSIYWRTNGSWKSPVIVMAPCGGYRPGLGPFHAQSFEATIAHVPGVDVYMPSNAGDAAAMLNCAFESGRPTLFLYPKVFLNDQSRTTSSDVANHLEKPGFARVVSHGDDITLVSWGSTVALCQQAARELQMAGVGCDVIDLCSLSPWNRQLVCRSVERTRNLVVVHEDNLSCGFGAEVLAVVSEKVDVPIKMRRVTRPDTYIPCNYANQLEVLPSLRRILESCAELLKLNIIWESKSVDLDGSIPLEAIGSSPADQQVTVTEWKVKEGQRIEAGDLIAECEAEKASFDMRAPAGGVIRDLAKIGSVVKVGEPLARILNDNTPKTSRRIPREAKPVIQRWVPSVKKSSARPSSERALAQSLPNVVGLSGFHFVTGSTKVENEELLRMFPGGTSQDIIQRTGITSRFYCNERESALSMAAAVARKALLAEKMTLADVDAIYVSTSTPQSISPSMACLLHYELSKDGPTKDMPASDILAACSGWLYALQAAYDSCQQRPHSRILVVTTEAMSHFVRREDFETAFVFGDAATATIVSGPARLEGARALLHRPVLSARGEDGSILTVGRISDGRCSPVEMQGVKVFPVAVRQINAMMVQACAESGWDFGDIQWVVPHQANGRIISAVQERSGITVDRVINNIASYGNTSSSSIPIALAEMLEQGKRGKVVTCAFGGGFTFAAATLVLQ